jgi:hypothetical protein
MAQPWRVVRVREPYLSSNPSEALTSYVFSYLLMAAPTGTPTPFARLVGAPPAG